MSHVSEFPWKWILRDQTKFKSRKRKSLWRVYVLNKTAHNCTELKWTTLCTYQWCLPRIRGWGKRNPRKFDFMKHTRVAFWHPQRRQGGKCDSAAILESRENLGMSVSAGKYPLVGFQIPWAVSRISKPKAGIPQVKIPPQAKLSWILDSFTRAKVSDLPISDLSLKFYNNRYFVPQLWEEIFAQNLIYIACVADALILLCRGTDWFTNTWAGCNAGYNYTKIGKSYTYRREIVLEFCVRIASILQMSIKWNSWPELQTSTLRHKPFLMMTCSGTVHIFFFCCRYWVKKFAGIFGSTECMLNCEPCQVTSFHLLPSNHSVEMLSAAINSCECLQFIEITIRGPQGWEFDS